MPEMPRTFRPAHLPSRAEQRRGYDQKRDADPVRRLYKTARWQKLRAAHLTSSPLCVMCKAEGYVTIAIICDHVEPHRGDEVKFWSGPFQSLCKAHHDREKQREERPGLR